MELLHIHNDFAKDGYYLAGHDDLVLELWLRLREIGAVAWKTKDGKVIPVKDLGNNHLLNIIDMIERKGLEHEDYLDGLSGDWQG